MKALISTFSILFFLAYPLFAQKGHWEVGLNGGVNISSAVGFKDNNSNWAAKPAVFPQAGLSLGYQFNDLYAFRFGAYLEQKGFSDSFLLNGHYDFYRRTNRYQDTYLSIPLLNEFHFFNHHLIATMGLDLNFSLWWRNNFGERMKEWGLVGGLGTQFNLTRKLLWRSDAKFNRGMKDWRHNYSTLSLNGLKTFNISTGLIYAFGK